MPELPEVETVVRALQRELTGRRITSVHVRHKPSVAGSPSPPQCVNGLRVQRVFRRGKFIRMELESGAGMAIHLRMTGWLGVVPAEQCAALGHARVWFALDGGADALLFRDTRTFGRIWCGPARDLNALPALARLGPEPLDISAEEFSRNLRARRGRLKALLLNQEFLAGVGNIYADEALFAARLHPLTDARRLNVDECARLHRAIQKVLNAGIRAGGTSVSDFRRPDGTPGFFQLELRAYGREGEPCSRCRAAIKRIVVAQRGTWFCSRCQKRKR
jgi:formamidopyrimidine-DNA glycosylase